MTGSRVLVVGAGPHALTAAAYLLAADSGLAGRICVADPQPWLAAWERRFARLRLSVLRSSCVHHPDPRPYALVEHVVSRGRRQDLVGPDSRPTTGVFKDFTDSLVQRLDLERARIPAAVTALHPRDDGRVDVHLGEVRVRVDHVVLATNAARPHVPLLGARHSTTVDLDGPCRPRSVCVVGGGLSAGHLALAAARLGTRVHLVTRRAIRAQAMDVDAVWLGHALPGYLETTPDDRARTVRAARAGSMPQAELTALQAHELVTLHQGRTVAEVVPCGRRRRVRLASRDSDDGHAKQLLVDEVWLGTGQHLDVGFDPVTSRLLREVPVQVVHGLPVLDGDLSWGGTAIHLMGGLTALQTGPAAVGLAGARLAAERWTTCVTGRPAGPLQYPQPQLGKRPRAALRAARAAASAGPP